VTGVIDRAGSPGNGRSFTPGYKFEVRITITHTWGSEIPNPKKKKNLLNT